MRNRMVAALAVLFLISVGYSNVQAQGSLTKGMVKFEFTDFRGDFDEAQLEQMRSMMGSTETTIYFKPGKLRTSVNMMGGMMKTNSFASDGEPMALYVDAMGQKIKVEAPENGSAMGEETEINKDDFEIIADKSDTKEIAGYTCHRVSIVPKGEASEQQSTVTLFVTDKINANNNIIQNLDFGAVVEGFPLEYTINAGGIYMTSTATEVSGDLPAEAFEFDDKGYKIMTPEEYAKQFGGMR